MYSPWLSAPAAVVVSTSGWVMRRVLAEADARAMPMSVTALKHTAAARFYERHGFILEAEGEWDLYFRRPAHPASDH